ncbi:MAG: hypothetical protein M3457_02525 [Chloroflexota bacterium]|nr:hypothetical protein [Chloroflexota bacterium]
MTVLLTIDGTDSTPEMRFRANPAYGLYHWLRAASVRGGPIEGNGFAEAFELVRRSFDRRGVRGMAEPWERAIAQADSHGDALATFERTYRQTGNDMVEAMRIAQPAFTSSIWPGQLETIESAVGLVRRQLASVFAEMARKHAVLLDLDWPPVIDVYLVGDFGGFEGAYSHPLTVDVNQHNGLTLFETILHEATHVADVNGKVRGYSSVGDRLMAFLASERLRRGGFDVWHAVIFASSAARVRSCFGDGYPDYASERGLFRVFGVPGVAEIWNVFEGNRDEARFFGAIRQDVRANQ